MLRMISIEVTGAPVAPAPADVLRVGGSPRDGRCTLGDGEIVELM
jgi:hypothetical protein